MEVPLSTLHRSARQVLALTDDTTDHTYLRTVLDTAWRGMGSASSNRNDGGALQVLQVAHRDDVDVEAVVALLSAAASRSDPPVEPVRGRGRSRVRLPAMRAVALRLLRRGGLAGHSGTHGPVRGLRPRRYRLSVAAGPARSSLR
jgi:hypothetical protein